MHVPAGIEKPLPVHDRRCHHYLKTTSLTALGNCQHQKGPVDCRLWGFRILSPLQTASETPLLTLLVPMFPSID